MGVFDFLSRKKCALCGTKILTDDEIMKAIAKYRSTGGSLIFAMEMTRAPGAVCESCNTTVCHMCKDKGVTWKNHPNCPQCGSSMKFVGDKK